MDRDHPADRDHSADREHELVLLGATGYVGRLTAQRLAADAPDGARIALAGRSQRRLTELRDTLPDRARDWPLLVVDVDDEDALYRLAAGTRVLVSTVGPYLRHGLPVVAACVRAGTDSADLTGETLFVRRSIESFHDRAEAGGTRIVHSCGFDSVPSDLGVALNADRARADGAGELAETVLHVRSMRGGLSGGTIDSLRQQVIEAAGDPALRRLVSSASALTGAPDRPSHDRAGGRSSGRAGRPSGLPVGRDTLTRRWSAPFLMGGYNRQIVLRSDALAGRSYGPGFRYREVIDTGRGPLAAVAATGVAAASTALLAAMALRPTRVLLDRLLPDPGQGPSASTRAAGRFVVEIDSATTAGRHYRTRIGADHDPGYDGTAVMLAQAGLRLARDELPPRSGVLTPVSALGTGFADRLRDCGFVVTTERLD